MIHCVNFGKILRKSKGDVSQYKNHREKERDRNETRRDVYVLTKEPKMIVATNNVNSSLRCRKVTLQG